MYLRVDTVAAMKLKPAPIKVHRNFKLAPVLDKKLRAEVARFKKQNVKKTQTDILETALAEYFATKH